MIVEDSSRQEQDPDGDVTIGRLTSRLGSAADSLNQ
jgi:hypothetical protein